MGFCCSKRIKFEGDSVNDIKKVIDLELLDLQKSFQVYRENGY